MKVCNCKLPDSMLDRVHKTRTVSETWCELCGYLAIDYDPKIHGAIIRLYSKFTPRKGPTTLEKFKKKRDKILKLHSQDYLVSEIATKVNLTPANVHKYITLKGAYERWRKYFKPEKVQDKFIKYKRNYLYIRNNIKERSLQEICNDLKLRPKTVAGIYRAHGVYKRYRDRIEREEKKIN